MFVLPPPPRYPINSNIYGTTISGAPLPIIETNNTLKHPENVSFSAGEGTYVLRDDIHLATPPPHPSEAPVIDRNPLATTPHNVTSGTKITLVPTATLAADPGPPAPAFAIAAVAPTAPGSRDGSGTNGSSSSAAAVEGWTVIRGDKESQTSGETDDEAAEKFGEGNKSLSAAQGGPRKKRQTQNIVKSNSSFVSRTITHDKFEKRMGERRTEGLVGIVNINRALEWLDMESAIKHEPLTKILFTKAHPLCHDINPLTRSPTCLDVIIGFSTGDIIWFEPFSNKYTRINKNGLINTSAVTSISWLPQSPSLFLAAHADGSLIVYDRNKDDSPFVPEAIGHPGNSLNTYFSILKSVSSENQRTNPLSYWNVAKAQITGFKFSPDKEHLAVVSEDQCLRVINFVKERLVICHPSYFGAFTCVAWSPDGRYIISGGQDDLVTIWSARDHRIVARCEGHHSWVTDVAFDPWRCDERTYRFGTVGADCRLLLWDFSEIMLNKPKGRQDEDEVGPATRASVPVLPPVMSKEVDNEPLSQIVFLREAVVTACESGCVKWWERPDESRPQTGMGGREGV
ncbi:catabolite repression protein creC [Pyronema domesticum]|nr:catabolite repression protein creC [Pyronema domesticum]